MITEDYEALVRNNNRDTYLGSRKQRINGNNITTEQQQKAERHNNETVDTEK
ncbi:hypothetical protein [Bacillus taeanensis]|uniref:hypothetical protein n=1 Tax=Bacillus taeanensis TaxID=273032 RepID=UPI0015F07A78|nr:hypothetical protein [Bacillus taeanensis]